MTVDETSDRATFFTPAWFAALFRGKYGLGDTFWGGSFGVQLVFVPIWVAAEILIQVTFPTAEPMFFLCAMLVILVYAVLLTRAVFSVAWRSPSAGGWRWAAVIYCLIIVGVAAKMSQSALIDIL